MIRRRILSTVLQALRADRGNVVVMFAVAMPLIVGGAGLGVETTYWRYKQVQLQAAADAASYAAAVEKRRGSGESAIRAAASLAAEQNGFTTASTSVTVSFPTTVNGAAVSNAVKVALVSPTTRFFTAYFGETPVNVRASSTANYTSTSASCILALDPSASSALNISGSATVSLTGCSLMSNSISATAATTGGSSTLTAPCIVSAGGVSLGGTVTLTECDKAMTEAATAPDPYKTIPTPTVPAGACAKDNTAVLSPGNYCNGMSLNGSVTLSPGTYLVSGKDFHVNGSADIQGTGVTIIVTGGSKVDINGNARVRLSAPTGSTDPYKGILFYGDRTITTALKNTFNGTADSSLTGAIYFPNQAVEYKGNYSGTNGCTQVVAKTVEWIGNTTLSMNCSNFGMQSVPIPGAVRLIG